MMLELLARTIEKINAKSLVTRGVSEHSMHLGTDDNTNQNTLIIRRGGKDVYTALWSDNCSLEDEIEGAVLALIERGIDSCESF